VSAVVDEPGTELERLAAARVELLVRKHDGLATAEDETRLAALTARMRELDPRVTKAELDELENMVAQLDEGSSRLLAIRSRFGLE
jgi:hypothetical protein